MRLLHVFQGLLGGQEPAGCLITVTQMFEAKAEVRPATKSPCCHPVHDVHLHVGEVGSKVANGVLLTHPRLGEGDHSGIRQVRTKCVEAHLIPQGE